MLANTINVASWLLLNALVPGSLPESVTKQHTDDQFVQWSPINSAAQWNVMFSSIKLLRFTEESFFKFFEFLEIQ